MNMFLSLAYGVALALFQLVFVRWCLNAIRDETALRLVGGGGLAVIVLAAIVWPMAALEFGALPAAYLATLAMGHWALWMHRLSTLAPEQAA